MSDDNNKMPKLDGFSDQNASGFFYNEQIKNYLKQFMAVFATLKVKVGENPNLGEERLASVPVIHGDMDRVVGHILADNTQNKMVRLPMMTTNIQEIRLDPDARKGVDQERRDIHLARGGSIPEDLKTVHQINPIPYLMGVELAIVTSNMDQHLQLFEQILTLFNPSLYVQTNDDAFDIAKIGNIDLTGINFDRSYPAGNTPRILSSILTFTCRIYLATPTDIRRDFITKIIQNVSVVSKAGPDEVVMQNILDYDELGFPDN